MGEAVWEHSVSDFEHRHRGVLYAAAGDGKYDGDLGARADGGAGGAKGDRLFGPVGPVLCAGGIADDSALWRCAWTVAGVRRDSGDERGAERVVAESDSGACGRHRQRVFAGVGSDAAADHQRIAESVTWSSS